MSVAEYEVQFTKLSRFASELVTTEQRRVRRFVQGLNVEVQEGLTAVRIDTFADAVEKAQRVEVARAQVKSFQAKKRFAPSSSREPTYGNAPPAKVGRGTSGVNSPGAPRGAQARGNGARNAGGRNNGTRVGPIGRGQPRNTSQRGRAIVPQVNCAFCKKPGHTIDGCWKKQGNCLRCGSSEHQIAGCPKMQEGSTPNARPNTSGGSRPTVPPRVYAIDDQPVPDFSEVVEGTLPIFHRLGKVLIDPGATHSFVNPSFMSGIDVRPVRLPFDLEVRTPMGNKKIISSLAYKNCEFWIGERKMLVDLISLDIKGYDVIIGMDFLDQYHAKLDCRAKVVEFCIPGEATLRLDVKGRLASSAMISGIRARKMLSKGAQGFLAFLINAPSDQVKLEDVPVVREFPDVFPEELKTLPPEREVEFRIDLVPGTAPISKTPYRMAPAELKELKIQLQDLLEKGVTKMYHDVKELYWWEGLKKDVAEFVQKCLICQQVKAEHQKPSGLLQPLEIPEWKWEHITMDFVMGLPRSQKGFDAIWVIVDRLTKSAHFLPVSMSFSLEKLVKLYTEEILRLHGIPVSIVYDRDPRFVSRFWQKFQESLGTKLKFSTAYHPQTDGQPERIIQTLEDLLRSCILDFGVIKPQFKWHLMKLLYGRRCRSPIHWDEIGEKKIVDPTAIPWIEEAQEKVKLIRERLQTAQNRQKSYTDIRRKDLEFEIGDKVFLRIKPLKGGVVSKRGKKVKPRYIGPFKILKRVGNVAYQLKLPASMAKVHDVFHVSMLKKYYSNPSHVLPLEGIEVDETLTYEEGPVKILERENSVDNIRVQLYINRIDI
ncbi:uncharacterized protein [Coffea arabica]|uniref:Integrase catalytic domain-containing protein n=1 Tax=Coffea arabica TaxID=13443 RepID=A0ABM4W2T4_COFAR